MNRRVVMAGPALGVQGGMTSVEQLILAHPPEGWHIEHVSTYQDGRPAQRLAASARGLAAARSRLAGANALHVHMSQRSDVLRAIVLVRSAERCSVPSLVHAHASSFDVWFDGLPTVPRAAVAGELRRTQLLAVLSESWKRYYHDTLGFPAERIVVLPNPVEVPRRPAPGSSDGLVRLAFLGRIGRRKGAFDLLQAVARLEFDVRSRLRLVVAGDGEVEGARRMVERLQLSGTVEVRSWLTPAQRDALLHESDAFVLPSRNEGLPMSLLEAMAHGLTPLTTPVGGIPELIQDGVQGLLVPPGDPAALAVALRRLVRSESERRALGRSARERVLPLSSERYTKRLAAAYERLECRVTSR